MPTLVNGIVCRDWRTCGAADVAPLVHAEIDGWRETLWWDVADAWSVIEPARQAAQLPGLVAFDAAGRPCGWTAYLPHHGTLQVMAFVAHDAAAASVLLETLLASAEARCCDSTIFSVRDVTPGLPSLLARSGFRVDPYHYLLRALADLTDGGPGGTRWQHHEDAMARLCAVAYRDSSGVRAFAPGGSDVEWREYIGTIVQGTGCGWFLPELSIVVPVDVSRAVEPPARAPLAGGAESMTTVQGFDGAGLQAGLMLSDLGTGTVHIAQLAVAPDARGRGLGRQLVQAALREASRFYERATLLVAASNTPAVTLYHSLGFREHGRLIVAARPARPL